MDKDDKDSNKDVKENSKEENKVIDFFEAKKDIKHKEEVNQLNTFLESKNLFDAPLNPKYLTKKRTRRKKTTY